MTVLTSTPFNPPNPPRRPEMSTTETTTDQTIEQLRAELEHAKLALMRDNEGIRLWMTDCAKVSDRLRSELSEARAEVKRLTAENVLLRGELRVTEDERDNARLDVEADVRAELAAKAGA